VRGTYFDKACKVTAAIDLTRLRRRASVPPIAVHSVNTRLRVLVSALVVILAGSGCKESSPPLWEAYVVVGEAETQQGNLPRAEDLLLQAARAAANGQPLLRVASAFRHLGHVYAGASAYEGALRTYERALRLTENADPKHREISSIHLEIGQVYERMGNLPRAEDRMRKALAIGEQRENELGFFRRFLMTSEVRAREIEALRVHVGNLARVLDKRGSYDEAERFYLRDIATMEAGAKANALYKVWTAYPVAALAEIYRKQRRFAESEARFQQALKVMEEQKLDNEAVRTTMKNYALLLRDLRRDAEARRILAEADQRTKPVRLK
jgi:tetratricopeptide (TPR) repeat protein